ncbi:hypothetical protein ABIE32_001476 [Comamonas sp. 4034]
MCIDAWPVAGTPKFAINSLRTVGLPRPNSSEHSSPQIAIYLSTK